MGYYLKYLYIFLAILCYTSCNRDSFELNSALENSGNNRKELERVLECYLQPGEYTTDEIDGFRIGNTVHKVTDFYNTFGVNGEGDYEV